MAFRNEKNRFFIPSKANYFGGLKYDFVMIDNGCNSILLPYKNEVATTFRGPEYNWKIPRPAGTGAVKCPTLVIKRGDERAFAPMRLAGSDELILLKSLRFHLGSASAAALQDHAKLSTSNKAKLTSFLTSMGGSVSVERQHVLLGQAYLKTVTSVQHGSVYMMCDFNMDFPTKAEHDIVVNLVEPMVVEDFEGFDALEDEDHNGDDDEECSFECIDEPNE